VVLAHYQLAHSAGANFSPHIRYAAFFRLSRRNHDPDSNATMTDIWREWAGLRA
jgi:hypothetical protein